MTDGARLLPSLRREIARILTLISIVWVMAVFFTLVFGIRHEVDDLMDDALQESAEILYGMLADHSAHLPLDTGGSMPAPPHDERLVWQIVDQNQRIVLHSHKAPLSPLLPVFTAGLSDAPGHWRVYAMRLPGAQRVLYVGQTGNERLESRYEAILAIGAGVVAVGLVCAVWMRRRVHRAMEPLQQLSEQVMRYDPMRPETDLPAPTRQEFVEVQDAIVDLGQRLARRVQREQAFAAHAAHALRTPLAGMDAQLAMAMKEVPDTARPRLERTREAVVRLKRVITSLLALFRSNAELDLQEVSLSELVARLPVESLAVHVDQQCALTADPNLLAAALVNLLDNAVRYGARQCRIICRSVGRERHVTLQDDGPGVTPERRAELQNSVDQPGDEDFMGLGLKLAALVARAHQGKLLIDVSVPQGAGFSVTMVLWSEAPAG